MKWIIIARSPAHITSLTEGLSSFLERLWGLKLRTHQKTSLNSRVFVFPCKVRGKLLCKLQIAHFFSVTLVSVVSSNAAILSGCNGVFHLNLVFISQDALRVFRHNLVVVSYCTPLFLSLILNTFFLITFHLFYYLIISLNYFSLPFSDQILCICQTSLITDGFAIPMCRADILKLGVFITLLLKHSALFRTILYFLLNPLHLKRKINMVKCENEGTNPFSSHF